MSDDFLDKLTGGKEKAEGMNEYARMIGAKTAIKDNSEDTDADENPSIGAVKILSLKERKVIRILASEGVIYREEKPVEFKVLNLYKDNIRGHLLNDGVKLTIVPEDGLAYTEILDELYSDPDAPISDAEDEVITVLRAGRVLSLHYSLVLIQLRKIYYEKESTGDDDNIVIDIDSLKGLMEPFEKMALSESKRREKNLNAALDYFHKTKLIKRITGENDRYQIRPLIKYVVNLEMMDEMVLKYLKMATDAGAEIDENIKESLPYNTKIKLYMEDK